MAQEDAVAPPPQAAEPLTTPPPPEHSAEPSTAPPPSEPATAEAPAAEPGPRAEDISQPEPDSTALQPKVESAPFDIDDRGTAAAAAEADPSAEMGVPDPPPPPPEPGTEPPGRARGRVQHPTEEHPAPEPPSADVGQPSTPPAEFEEAGGFDEPRPSEEPASSSEKPQLFDFEAEAGLDPPEDQPQATAPAPAPPAPRAPEEDEDDYAAFEGGETGERGYVTGDDADDHIDDDPFTDEAPAVPREDEGEDLLAGSPEFAEAEDDEDLWFEKGPPKNFDFEDKD
ncbi:MAG: hypothetical protein K0S15_1741 [Solirubrobacterales bacterium]|nr:hypothetical protein [Solirubrobacterales bacterium]